MAKTLLELHGISVRFGEKTALDIDSLYLYDVERIGLVGENGAGKSTLLKVISGDIIPDSGHVTRHGETAFIRQLASDDLPDIDNAKLSRLYDAKPASDALSGGEKTRIRIAAALGKPGQLLLADEPTSDLDEAGITLLEKSLKQYNGAVLLVSHDRALLNAVCNRIDELEDGKITSYPGNYDDYQRQKAQKRDTQQAEYDQYRTEQARMRSSMQSRKEQATQVLNAPKRMGNSEARLHKRNASATQKVISRSRKIMETRLDNMEVKQRPRDEPNAKMQLGAGEKFVSKVALTIRDLTLRVPGKTLLSAAEMICPTASRTALMGQNGCGKSTLLKRLAISDPRVRFAPGVKIGLFDQDHQCTLNLDRSILENVRSQSDQPEDVVRTVLAHMGIRGDQVFESVGVLSGGERAKVAIAKLLVSDANFLILDEPTNHLDIFARTALEEMLADYKGTLLFVSHDRAFIRRVATRFIRFEHEKLITVESDLQTYEQAPEVTKNDGEEIDRMMLDIKLAALSGRIAHPKKHDDVVKLREEYEVLFAQKMRPS